MEHKIVAFNAGTGSATVKFWTEAWPDGLLFNIDVPVENGAYISGAPLDALIQSFAPVGQIARLVSLRDNPPSAAGIIVEAPPVVPEPVPKDPILDADTLADAIAFAEKAIDRAASKARALFVSDGVGQEATYIAKGEQAAAYQVAGYTGPVPAYIAAEAQATGATAQATADLILSLRDQWNGVVGPAIEAARVGGKKKVREATTVQAVDTELRAANLAIQAIHP